MNASESDTIHEDSAIHPDVRYILDTTQSILEACGPRLAGTEASRKAGRLLEAEFHKSCDHTESEVFTHSASIYSTLKVAVFAYVAASITLFLPAIHPLIPLFLYFVGAAYFFLVFILFKPYFDFLFPRRECMNVHGIIEPSGEVRSQVLLSGHHDSGRVMQFMVHFQKLYAYRYMASAAAYGTGLLAAILVLLQRTNVISVAMPSWILPMILFALSPLIFQLWTAMSPKGSPGAGDNLASSVLMAKIGQRIKDLENDGKGRLKHVRVILASFDSEETGFHGAKVFVREHRGELTSLKTINLNYECLYHLHDLGFATTDQNGFVKLSSELALKLHEIAERRGFESDLVKIPIGGGGTDASAFALAGIPATTILGISTKPVRSGLVYHTPDDLVENLEPEILEAVLDLSMEMLKELDENELE